MGTRPLTEAERQFAEKLLALILGIQTIQEEARAVRAAGGDCKRAFLTIIPEENRGDFEMQWPMLSLLLGGV